MVRNHVRAARVALDMTQETLAKKTGVTRQTIILIEKEKYNPTIMLCFKLCQALNKTLETLFYWEVVKK